MGSSKTKEIELNKHFWAFIYLIVETPEIFLNNKGKAIHKVVIDKGCCKSLTNMSKFINITKSNITHLFNKTEIKDFVIVQEIENRKEIRFKENIIKEGSKMASGIVGR